MSLHWIYVLEIQISDRKCMFEQKLSAKNEPKESIEWKLLPETSRTKSSTHSSKIGEGGSVPQSFSYDFNSGSWFVALWGGATVPETTTPKNESRISGHQTTENEMAKEEDWWLCHGFGSDAFCMLTFWTRTKFSIAGRFSQNQDAKCGSCTENLEPAKYSFEMAVKEQLNKHSNSNSSKTIAEEYLAFCSFRFVSLFWQQIESLPFRSNTEGDVSKNERFRTGTVGWNARNTYHLFWQF